MPIEVKIEGVDKAKAGLRATKRSAPLRLKVVSKEAARLVAPLARGRVPQGAGRNGHASSSVKVSTVGGDPGVIGGSSRFTYYAWLEFGGRVGRKRRTVRPWKKGGRYIFKAYVELKPRIHRMVEDAMVEAGRDAGWDVD